MTRFSRLTAPFAGLMAALVLPLGAPPGTTLIRGGMDITAPEVVVQHIRIRAGSAASG